MLIDNSNYNFNINNKNKNSNSFDYSNSNNDKIILKKGYHISSKNTFFKVLEDVYFSKRDDWVKVDSHLAPVGNNFNETLELINNQCNGGMVPLVYTNLLLERNDNITHIRNQVYFEENEEKKLYENCRVINSKSIIRNAISGYNQLTDKYLLYKNLLNSKKMYAVPTLLINKGKIETTKSNDQIDDDSENYNDKLWYFKDPLKNKSEGIHLFSSKEEALEFSNQGENKEKRFLLQKEITPMLLEQHYKFDLRVYLVIVFTPSYTKCYMYNEGIIRSTNTVYVKGTPKRELQLTNYCYQKQVSSEFQRIYRLSDISKSQFNGIEPYQLFEKSKECTSNYFSDILLKLNHLKHTGFTLFGLDYIFDINMNPYLLEINYSPSPFQNSPNNVPLVVQDLCRRLEFIAFDPLLNNKEPIIDNFIEINSINFNNGNDDTESDLDDFELF